MLVLVFVLFGIALLDQPADPVFEGKLASQWSHELLNSNAAIREKAEEALKAFGEPGVPQLRALLRRRNGPWEKPLLVLNRFVPFLNYSAVNADACRVAAARVLGKLGGRGHAAAPDLVAGLRFELSAAESERALLSIGAAAIPAVEGGVSARDVQVRFRSARLLREFHAANQSSIRVLVDATSDKFSRVRREAAASIGEIVARNRNLICDDRSAVEAIVALGEDSASEVRAGAMQCLGRIGIDNPQVMSSLRKGLCDDDVEVKLESAKALWALCKLSEEVLPVLISVLETPERWRAAYALAEMGSSAAPAIPALLKLLVEERVPRPFRTPPSSALALGKIGAMAVPELARTLENPDSGVRMNALMALNFMGAAGQTAVPNLIQLLEDKNAEIRHTTALTLATIGVEPSAIIAGLSDCLQAEDIYMRSAAAAHLRRIAPDQNWVVPAE